VYVQPLVWAALQASIIQVVPVNIDPSTHPSPSKSNGGHMGRRAPRHRSTVGDMRVIYMTP
jgi:hypothetical protein